MNTRRQNFIFRPEVDLEEFGQYLYERENAQATVKKYLTDIRTFVKYMDGKNEIDKERILNYKEWLLGHYAPGSINSMLVALNQFLEFLGAGRLKVRRVKVQKQIFLSEEKNLTKEDYNRLRDTALLNGKEQLALIIEVIASTGIRVSELRYFTAEQVRKGRIEVFNKEKYRRILIPELLRKKLLCYLGKNSIRKGFIFTTRNGNPKDRSNLWGEMKALCRDAGVEAEKVFPHNLRHLFARTYYRTTKDLAGLADLLGHSSLEITRIYTANTGLEYQIQMNMLGTVFLKQ